MAEEFGRYQIERELGRGATGVVYLARDQALQRPLALKVLVLPPNLQGAERQEALNRFLREARAAAAIRHPSVPEIYDVGRAGGQCYIAMEYCHGPTLRDTLRMSGPLPPARAVEVVLQLLDALAAAHALGICHRDVKPDNVILPPDGRPLKLMDFGIAHVAADPSMTQAGVLLGTPSYMSPEQALGSAVDARSDLFSAGILLHEALVGHRPFSGTTVLQITHAIAYEPSRVAGSLPAPVQAVIARALAKDPALRFQSAAEMCGALRAAAWHFGTAAPPLRAPGVSSPSAGGIIFTAVPSAPGPAQGVPPPTGAPAFAPAVPSPGLPPGASAPAGGPAFTPAPTAGLPQGAFAPAGGPAFTPAPAAGASLPPGMPPPPPAGAQVCPRCGHAQAPAVSHSGALLTTLRCARCGTLYALSAPPGAPLQPAAGPPPVPAGSGGHGGLGTAPAPLPPAPSRPEAARPPGALGARQKQALPVIAAVLGFLILAGMLASMGRSRAASCAFCGGSGECRPCGGSGETACTFCAGRGSQSCFACNGTGVRASLSMGGVERTIPCGMCSGTGSTRCWRCAGRGRGQCASCGGSGDCRPCGGTGLRTDEGGAP